MTFATEILQPSREFSARLVFDSFTLEDDKIISIGLNQALMSENFEIGTAFADVVEIELFNQNEDLLNLEFKFELGLLVGATVEWVSMGYFTVESSVVNRDKTVVTAIDRMYKFGGQYETTLTFPATVLQVLQDVCTQAGVTLATTTFPNSTVSIPLEPSFLGYSMRNIVARVSEVAGGWAKFNRDGELTILNAVDTNDYTITKDNYITLDNDEVASTTIGKVRVQTGEVFSELGTGTEVLIKDNLLVQTPSDFVAAIYNALNGLSFEPLSLYWQGNFSLNLAQKLIVDGFDTYLFNRFLSYNGGLRETYKTPAWSDVKKDSFTNGALTIAVENAISEIRVAQDEIELKVGKDEIISSINLTPEEIKIQAERISLEGIITANGNVKIDEDGNIEVNNGIFNGKIISESGTIANFSLIPNYATIVAGTSGKAITAGSGTTRVGMSPGVTTGGFTYSFWAGNDNPINAPFRVLRNGGLRSTDAVIAGWTMSGTSISRGSTSLSASGTNGTLTIGGGTLSAGSSSQMTYSGAFAITGTTAYSGSINAGTSLINISGVTTRMNYNGQWTATGIRWGVNGGSALSDLRLKHDIKDIDGSFIFKLRPVEFRYDVDGRDLQYGLIAQEVEEILGDNVAIVKKPNEENEHYGLDYTQLIAPMIATIQYQQKEIDELKERLDKLEKLI